MGYRIEYLAPVAQDRVRGWLDRQSGYYLPACEPLTWEGTLATGGTFWAEVCPENCLFSLAVNYTALLLNYPRATDFAAAFERELWAGVGRFPIIRLDEILRVDWEQQSGSEWPQIADPFPSLLKWLATREQLHWKLVSPPSTS